MSLRVSFSKRRLGRILEKLVLSDYNQCVYEFESVCGVGLRKGSLKAYMSCIGAFD